MEFIVNKEDVTVNIIRKFNATQDEAVMKDGSSLMIMFSVSQ